MVLLSMFGGVFVLQVAPLQRALSVQYKLGTYLLAQLSSVMGGGGFLLTQPRPIGPWLNVLWPSKGTPLQGLPAITACAVRTGGGPWKEATVAHPATVSRAARAKCIDLIFGFLW